MWADYFKSNIEPTDISDMTTDTRIDITFSGVKPQLKIGGSYKKLTVNYYSDEEITDFESGTWEYKIDGDDATSLLTILTSNESQDINENQIKIKFIGNYEYIGKILNVKFTGQNNISASLDMEIISL